MVIQCEGISKSFNGYSVFKQLDYEIKASGIYGVTGASGSGKTTFIRVLMGLEAVDEGQIKYQKPLKFATAFPEDRLIPTLTALENITYVAPDKQEIGERYLKKLGLASFYNHYPKELSSGMQRRVAIARALTFQGDLLILDEPFKGLDQKMKEIVATIFQEYSQQHPILLVDHDITLMKQIAGNILNIEDYK